MTLSEFREKQKQDFPRQDPQKEYARHKIIDKNTGKINFESVKTQNGKTILLPYAHDYLRLYREQCENWSIQASIYRENATDIDIFINKIKLIEFEKLIEKHPGIVDFKDENIFINPEGLAQHYGIKTTLIDFTCDLGIALYFALKDQHSNLKHYKCYIYTLENLPRDDQEYFCGDISVLGLQPLERPGRQAAFFLNGEKVQSAKIEGYEIIVTEKERDEIIKKFNGEKHPLNTSEIIEDKAKAIVDTTIFTSTIFEETFERFPPESLSKKELKKKLEEKEIKIDDSRQPDFFTQSELSKLNKDWGILWPEKYKKQIIPSSMIQATENTPLPQKTWTIYSTTDQHFQSEMNYMNQIQNPNSSISQQNDFKIPQNENTEFL